MSFIRSSGASLVFAAITDTTNPAGLFISGTQTPTILLSEFSGPTYNASKVTSLVVLARGRQQSIQVRMSDGITFRNLATNTLSFGGGGEYGSTEVIIQVPIYEGDEITFKSPASLANMIIIGAMQSS